MPETDVTFFNRQGLKFAGVLNLSAAAKATAPGPRCLFARDSRGSSTWFFPKSPRTLHPKGSPRSASITPVTGIARVKRAGSTHLRGSTARLRLSLGSDGTRVSTPVALALSATAMEARGRSLSRSGVERARGRLGLRTGRRRRDARLGADRVGLDRVQRPHREGTRHGRDDGPVDLGRHRQILPFSRAFLAAYSKLKAAAGARARWRPVPTPAITGSSLPASPPCSTYTLKPPVGWGAGRC
jgi:hypothetical protein